MSSVTVPRRATIALFALALPGIASSLAVLPVLPGVPRPLLLVGPVTNVIVALLLGGWAAPRVGLRSRIVDRLSGASCSVVPREAATIAVGSTVAGMVVAAIDHATRRSWQSGAGAPPSLVEAWSSESVAVGVLYGGVVEELLFRWGLTSFVAWALWRVAFRRHERAPAFATGFSVLVAALVFAAAHLPAMAVHAPLGVGALLRSFGWNAGVGLVFGALYVRRDLESAMLAHASLHLGFAVIGALFDAA